MEFVFWIQMGVSFLLWIAVGIRLMKASVGIREHAFRLSRPARGMRSAILFLLSPGFIFAPLWLMWTSGSSQPDRLVMWAWALVTIGGLGCVVSATVGLCYAVSLAIEAAANSSVTTAAPAASTIQDPSDK